MLTTIYLRKLVTSLFSRLGWTRKKTPFQHRQSPKTRWNRPGVETLESRIAPATLTYVAPLGQPFTATLRSTGSDLQLVDASNHVLADQALSSTTGVSITGSNQASALTVDLSTPYAVPITFDGGPQTVPTAAVLHLIGDDHLAATYTPGLTAGDSSTILFGNGSISFTARTPVLVENVADFLFLSPGSADNLTITNPAVGETAIGGTSGGALFGPATFTNVPSVVIDNATHSGDQITLNPNGLTAAGLTNFSVSSGTVALGDLLNLDDPTFKPNVSSGEVSITAATATLLPGSAFTGRITDLTGVSDLAAEQFNLSAGQLALSAENFFTAQADNVPLAFDTQAGGAQTLATLSSANLTVDPLNNLSVPVTNLAIRSDGFSFDDTTVTPATLTLGANLNLDAPTVAFSGINYSATSGYSGELHLTTDEGEMFAGQPFVIDLEPSGNIAALEGDFDLNAQVFHLTVGSLDLHIGNPSLDSAVDVAAGNFPITYDPQGGPAQTLAHNVTATITIDALNIHGSDPSFTLDANGFSLGSGVLTTRLPVSLSHDSERILEFNDGVTVNYDDFSVVYGAGLSVNGDFELTTVPPPGSSPLPGDDTGGSAVLFPDSTVFTATVGGKENDAGTAYDPAVDGKITFNGAGAPTFSLALAKTTIKVGEKLDIDADRVTLTPDGNADGVVFSVDNAQCTIDALGITGEVKNLEIDAAGDVSVASVTINTADVINKIPGLAGGLLPINLKSVTVAFPGNSGGRQDLSDLQLTVTATLDPSIFNLPFTPIIQIGNVPLAANGLMTADSQFSFTIAINNGVVTPYTIGPITIGFADLHVGPVYLGETVKFGGYQEGVWVPDFGGSISISNQPAAGGSQNVFEGGANGLLGTLYGGVTDGVLNLTGLAVGNLDLFDGKVSLETAKINFGATISTVGGFSFKPTIGDVSVEKLSVEVGSLLTFQAANVALDFNATGSDPIVAFQGDRQMVYNADDTFELGAAKPGSLSVTLGNSAGPLSGWGGEAGNFAVGADGSLHILQNFFVQLRVGSNSEIGLPKWLPIVLTDVEIKLDSDATDADGILVHPEDFTLFVSGGINTQSQLPITGTFSNIGIDVGKLITDLQTGADPIDAIVDLNGFTIGVSDLNLGPLHITGALTLGETTVHGATAVYAEVKGDVELEGEQVGIDVALSNYGPLLATLSGGVVGPFGVEIEFENVGFVFGGPNFPEITDPQQIFTNPNLKDPTAITLTSITKALTTAIDNHQYTWDSGFTLVGHASISDIAVQGLVTGDVVIGANIALEGPRTGLKILAEGSADVYGFPLASAALYFNFSNLLDPKVQFAFVEPDPHNPLSFLFPSMTMVSGVLDFNGVIPAMIIGVDTFFQQVVAGSLQEGNQLFTNVFNTVAANLQADHTSNLARIILDVNGAYDSNDNPVVTPLEDQTVITTDFFTQRVLQILSPNLSDLVDFNILTEDTLLIDALLPALISEAATEIGAGGITQVVGDLAPVLEQAALTSLNTAGSVFDPSLTLTALVQPTIFSIPLGSPTQQLNVLVNKEGISFGYEGSIVSLLQQIMDSGVAIPRQLLGLNDETAFDVSLPLPTTFLTDLITGAPIDLSTVVNATSGWEIYLSVTVQAFGTLNLGTAAGYIFGPSPLVNGAYQTTPLFQHNVINLDPNNTGKPDPVLQAEVAGNPDLIGVDSTAEYINAEKYGGILFSGKLSLPSIIEDPAGFLESIPTSAWTNGLPAALPSNPSASQLKTFTTQAVTYVKGLANLLTAQQEWGNLNFYVPGLTGLLAGASPYIEGYADLKLFGLDLGQARLQMIARDNPDGSIGNGLDASIDIPWLGGFQGDAQVFAQPTDVGTFLYNLTNAPFVTTFLEPLLGSAYTNLQSAFQSIEGQVTVLLPAAGVTGTVSLGGLENWLSHSLGLPSAVFSPANESASVTVGLFTPGFDLSAPADSVRYNGGLTLDAALNIAGLVNNADFHFEIQPFSFINSTNLASALIPNFEATASVGSLTIPFLGNDGHLLAFDNFAIDIDKNSTGLSLNLNGQLFLLGSEFSAAGEFQVSNEGLWGSLLVQADSGVNYGPLAFTGVLSVDLNMTGESQMGEQGIIPAHSAHVLDTGTLRFGSLSASGTFSFTAEPGSVSILADASTSLGVLGTVHVHGDLTATSAGVVSELLVTGGLNTGLFAFTGTTVLGINTTSASAEGIPANSFEFVATGALSLLGLDSLNGTFVLIVGANSMSVSAVGEIQIPIFGMLQAFGSLVIDAAGMAGALTVTLPSAGLSGGGYSLTGSAELEVNTSAQSRSLSAFTVNTTTGAVTPSQTIVVAPHTGLIEIGGSLGVGGVIKVAGDFKAALSTTSLVLQADAGISVFNVMAHLNGAIAVYSDGISADTSLSIPTFGVPGLFQLGANAQLEFNTRGITDPNTGVPANTVMIALTNGNFSILGIGLSLSYASLTVQNGNWVINVPSPGLQLNIGPLHGSVSGTLSSNGQFNLTGTATASDNEEPAYEYSITGTVTLSNNGFSVAVHGDAGVAGILINFSGSLTINSGGVSLTVDGFTANLGNPGYSPPSSPTTSTAVPPTSPPATVVLIPPTSATEGLPVSLTAQGVQPGVTVPNTTEAYTYTIFRPDGSIFTTLNDAHSALMPLVIRFTPDSTGNYRINVTAFDSGYLATTTSSIVIPVASIVNNFTFVSTGSPVYGNPATVAFLPANPTAVTYSYDFNDNGSFTDPGDVANSTSTQASFTFPHPGNYTVHARVTDRTGASGDYYTTVTVVPADVTVQPVAFAPLAGVAASQEVATFTDLNANNLASNTGATISWGDGVSSRGTVVALGGGNFAVYGAHTYANPGSYPVAVSVQDGYGGTGTDVGYTTALGVLASNGVNVPLGLNNPVGLAFDSSGNLFVANSEAGVNTISEVRPSGFVSLFASGLNNPTGLALDSTGSLYVANSGDGTIRKITLDGVTHTFATGLSNPQGLAFDSSGNLYVACADNTIRAITPAGVVTTFASGLNNPYALAFDAAGNLTVANLGVNQLGSTISKITPAGFVTTFATGLSGPDGLAFDSSGNLYVANAANFTISKITRAAAVSTVVGSGLAVPTNLAFDRAGNLYVANSGNNTINKVSFTPAPPTTMVSSAPQLQGKSLTATAGSTFSGTVATFTAVSGFTPAGALINWGDGSSSDGVIVSNGGGFNIAGSHVYTQGGNYTPVVQLTGSGLSIAAGGAAAVGYVADTDFSGGSTSTTADVITTANVVNPAPLSVYQGERHGNFTYTIPNLVPGTTYGVRLQFADPTATAAGQRAFNVAINGTAALTNFDIFAAAGGQDRAIVPSFTVTADSSGAITVAFASVTGLAKVDGLQILPVVASTKSALTAYDAPLTLTTSPLSSTTLTESGVIATLADANPFDQASNLTATIHWGDGYSSPGVITGGNGAFTISGTHVYGGAYGLGGSFPITVTASDTNGFGIAAGGATTTNQFVADTDFQGGATTTSTDLINTAFVPNAAPQSVYQGQRYGDFTYTIPSLNPGALYQVRLDFAETQFQSAGQRLFNVAINGTQVLTDLDVYAAAGGADTALGESFLASADGNGNITIAFSSVASMPMVSGIEITPAATGATTATVQGNQLAVAQQPATGIAGDDLPTTTFQILDDNGHPTTSTSKVTVAVNGPGGFTTGSPTSVFAVNGFATFSNLVLNQTGSYTLTASAAGDASVTTNSFTVGATVPTSLQFVQGPSLARAGSAIAPAVTVQLEDANGNPAASTAGVTITASGPGGFTANSLTTVNAVAGLATFSNLVLTVPGPYTLTVSSTGLTPATSANFTLIAPPTAVASPATGLTASLATLNGTVNPNDASTTVQFVYGTSPTLSSGTTTVTAALGVSGGSVVNESYALTGLAQSTTYYFEEVATNSAGATTSSIVSFTTPTLPTTTTSPATLVGGIRATVNGAVNPNGFATTVSFIYGTDPSLLSGTSTAVVATGVTGASTLPESTTITGLAQNTTYYFEEVATNAAGTTTGSIQSFTTGVFFNVTSSSGLIAAINSANTTPGNIELDLTANGEYQFSAVNNSTVGPTALPAVSGTILLVGNGATIDAFVGTPMRLFYITPAGNLTLVNVTLQGGVAQGGAGGNDGGGGGAGLGGAVWNSGALTLVSTTLSNNQARGGAGGAAIIGTGGTNASDSGGGGGGLSGNGANGAGLGNNSNFYSGGNGGSPNGGGGGAGGFSGNPGSVGGLGGGGGGGGRAGGANETFTGIGGQGGAGGFGGGGGGGGTGGRGSSVFTGSGGAGGFGGGGGGGGQSGGGQAGFGGGNGSGGQGAGGGAAGLGGAIFNDGGDLTIINSTLTNNSAIGGSSNAIGAGVGAGEGLGGAIFARNGTITLLNDTIHGNTAPSDGDDIYELADGAPITVVNNSGTGGVNASAINGGSFRGPLSGATVFFDPNFTGVDVAGDPSAITRPDGSYSLVVSPATIAAGGQFVVIGGIDTSTGLANVIPLTAPADYTVIDPFSTLVNDMVRNNGLSEQAAAAAVAQTLGLPSNVNLASYNLIAAEQTGDRNAPKVFAAEVTLDQTVYLTANLVSGASSALSVAGVGATVYSVLAQEIATSGSPINLSSSTAVSTLIQDVATASGVSLPAATVSGAASVIAGVSQEIAATPLTAQATSFVPVLQAQVVAEGTIAPQLASVAASQTAISTVVANNTGAALQAEISASSYGTIIPAALSISDVARQSLNNGSTIYTFTVSLTAIPAPTQTVSVSYTTQDASALAANGDYTPTSGTLTWAPGDTSPKTISVVVNGEAGVEPSKAFDVVLLDPQNVTLVKAVGVGAIVSQSQGTTTVATTSNSSAPYGQGVTLTATVSTASNAGTPAGTVTFTTSSSILGTATLDGNGVASLGNVTLPVGSYTVTATYSGANGFGISSTTVSQTVIQATPTFALSPVRATYNGQMQGVSTDVFGANGSDLGPATIRYYTGTTLLGAAPTHAGSYTATASFAGNANVASGSASTTIVIAQATPTITLNPVAVTYNGQAQAVAAEVIGANGSDLGPAAIRYFSGTTLLGAAPVDAGGYTVTAAFAGSSDYSSASATTTLTIAQATPSIMLNSVGFAFDGQAHGITAEAFGVNGVNLGPATIAYSIGGTSLAAGAMPMSLGVYTATATFGGNSNYSIATATATVTIGQGTPSITLNPVTVTYDGNAHGVTAGVIGANGANLGPATIAYSLNGVSLSAPVHAGVYTVTASFAGDANDAVTSVTSTITIVPATPTISLSPVGVTYDGNAHGVTAEVHGVGNTDLGPATITYNGSTTAPTATLAYVVAATFASNQDYTSAAAITSLLIFPSMSGTPIIALLPVSATYNGQTHGASAEVYGANGIDLGPATLSYSTSDGSVPVHAGVYRVTASYAGSPGYIPVSAISTITIARAIPTIALPPVSVAHDGQPHSLKAEVFGVGGVDLGPAAVTYPSGQAPSAVGVTEVTATFAGNQDYTAASATTTLTITSTTLTPTLTLTPLSVPYDGTMHSVSADAFGLNNTDLGPAVITYSSGSAPSHAGVYTATASFAPTETSDGQQYAGVTATTTITITQATPTIVLSPLSVTYNGQSQPLSATVIGANQADLGPATIAYPNGAPPVDAGVYTVTASFAGNQDYTPAASVQTTITILKATPTFAFNSVLATYNGQPHAATAEVVDTFGNDLGPATITYSNGSTPVNPGEYTATATFAGSQNYTAATTTVTIIILPNTSGATVVAINPVSATYDGQQHGASAEVYGVNGLDLGPATIAYSLNGVPLAPGATPTDAGTYTVTASFAGDAIGDSSATATSTVTIVRATPTITINPVTATFDGMAHAATAQVLDLNGASLGSVVLAYSTSDGSVPVHAGVYTATATFAGNTDYASASVSTTIAVAKATPTVTVNPVSVTFDGAAHSATAQGLDLNGHSLGAVAIGYNTSNGLAPVDAGDYTVTAAYAGNTDYTSASATSTVTIGQATPTITLSPVAAAFNGQPQLATALVYGVNHVALGSAVITYSNGATPIDPGTYTALANFAGNQDYCSATATTTVTITQATATIILGPTTVAYTGQPQHISAEVFAGTMDLGPALIAYNGSGVAPVQVGTYSVTATFAGTADYTVATASTTFTITQPAPTFRLNPVSVTFDEQAHGATAEVFGIHGEDLGAAVITYSTSNGQAPVDAGVYTATASFAGNTDYVAGSATTTITIAKAAPTIVVSPVSVTFDGQAHAAMGGAFGLEGEPFGPTSITYSTSDGSVPVHAGTYTATATFAGSTDYARTSVTTTVTIARATPTITVNPVRVIFDNTAHSAVVEVYGVNNADLGHATVTYNIGGAPVHVGVYTTTASFAGNNDYAPTSATGTITITPATPRIVLNAITVGYDGQAQGAHAEVYGAGGVDLGPATITYSTSNGSVPVQPGVYTVTATFAGSSDYSAASASSTATILSAVTTTTLTSNPTTIFSNRAQVVLLTATVTSGGSSSAVSEGAVTFTIKNASGTTVGTTTGRVTVGRATGMFQVPAGLATGNYTVTAFYSNPATTSTPHPGFIGSTAATNGSFTIRQASTSVSNVTASAPSYSTTAQTLRLSARVSSSANTGTTATVNEGVITFTVVDANGHTLGTVKTNVSGGAATASFSILAGQAVGGYSVSASYSDPVTTTTPHPNYTTSSGSTTFTINKAMPTVIVGFAENRLNGPVILAVATVNGVLRLQGVAPTLVYYSGTLTAAQIATATPLSGAPEMLGSYTVVARFPGSADYTSAVSAPVYFTLVRSRR